jgi:nickel/cobalt transporter (NicO) family protein
MVLYTAYLGVLVIGLLHGLEPGHGWPIAFFYSMNKNKPLLAGVVSSSILAFFHFLSSIFAAAIFVLIKNLFNLSVAWLQYLGAAILIVLGIVFWREKVQDFDETQHGHLHGNRAILEHEHEHTHTNQQVHTHAHIHQKSAILTLSGIALYAFILGFAHEEEFALLALAVGDVNPWLLMIIYGCAVTGSIIGVTLLCIKTFEYFSPKLQRFSRYIPKISAITLFILAIGMIFNIF